MGPRVYSRNCSNKPASSSIIEFAIELSTAGRGSGFGGDSFACCAGDNVGTNGSKVGFDNIGVAVELDACGNMVELDACGNILKLPGKSPVLVTDIGLGDDAGFKASSRELLLEKEANDGVAGLVVKGGMAWVVGKDFGEIIENDVDAAVVGVSDDFGKDSGDENDVDGGAVAVAEELNEG